MRGIRGWLTSGALLAGAAGVQAQMPAASTGPEPAGLPGGVVVAGPRPKTPASASPSALPPGTAVGKSLPAVSVGDGPLPAGTPVSSARPKAPAAGVVPASGKDLALPPPPLPLLPAPAPPAPGPSLPIGSTTSPALPDPPPVEPALPAGSVVGSSKAPAATVTITTAPVLPAVPPAPVSADPPADKPAPPAEAVPLTPKGTAPAKEVKDKDTSTPAKAKDPAPKADAPASGKDGPPPPIVDAMTAGTPIGTDLPGGQLIGSGCANGACGAGGAGCCGPVGGHGPVGQEFYIRTGPNFPYGNGLLARNLTRGWALQGGGRTQLFDADGAAAWALDLHVTYVFNEGKGQDIYTDPRSKDPVTLREMHRTSLGLGVGRDYFLARPGFILGAYDTNFRLGWDAGGRWGAGHVDQDPVFEEQGYRRHYDVFGQAFFGLTATAEVPCGGWTFLIGGRAEVDRTFSDLIPIQSSFYEGTAMFMLGVRY